MGLAHMKHTLWPTVVEVIDLGIDVGVPEFHATWREDWISGDFLPELKRQIDSAVNRYFVHCGFSDVDLAQLLPGQVWLNDLAAGRHILPHTHGVSPVGWTYYLDVDHDSGAIVFLDPKGNTAWDYFQHPPRPGVGAQHQYCQRFSPVGGQLIIFPGWLTHYVEPGTSVRRLSLSGEHYEREFLTRALMP
jgi:uncharacterized protein (TIGR02466 family)